MTKEEKQLEKKKKLKQEQEELKQRRQDRINMGLPAEELETIEKNLYLHKTLYTIMKLFNTLSGYKKDFYYESKNETDNEKAFINKMIKKVEKKFKKIFYANAFKNFLNKQYKEHPEYKGRPIIFAFNHVRMQDIAIEMDAIPSHMVLLSGDFENVHPDISGKLLEKHGIVYLDMDNPYDDPELKSAKTYLDELEECIEIIDSGILNEKYGNITSDELKEEYEKELNAYNEKASKIINDRKNIKVVIKDILNKLYNMLWYFEASWDFSENKPYYDGYYYIVQAAIDSNGLVLPGAFDLIEKKHFLDRRKVCIRLGEIIDYKCEYEDKILSKAEKCEGLDILKGEVGKALFDIWEENSFIKRDDLAKKYSRKLSAEDYFVPDYKRPSPLRAYWDEYIKKALKEWKFTEQDIKKKHFVDKTKVEQEDVFKHLDDLNLNQKNAFLLSKRNHH